MQQNGPCQCNVIIYYTACIILLLMHQWMIVVEKHSDLLISISTTKSKSLAFKVLLNLIQPFLIPTPLHLFLSFLRGVGL